LSLLGLARRSGQVQVGVERVREAIRAGRAALVVTAHDASPAQLDKVRAIAARRGVAVRSLGNRVALGAALGIPHVSAVAVAPGSLADAILADLDSLEKRDLRSGVE
jgi:ribosomal protein L7Ae-like RNA K-turn-binding protein